MSHLAEYWNAFYASRASDAVPLEPSAFARWLHDWLTPGTAIAEFGFGNARDSLWFAKHGHSVEGFDFAESAVKQAQGHADGQDVPARFHMLDLYDAEAAKQAGERIARLGPRIVYGRFLIHSLRDEGRHNLFDLSATALADGGNLCLEFRTGKDAGSEHLFGDDHFRMYLDPGIVEDEIVHLGGKIVHSEAGYGLAVYKTEDPHVARIVASWV